MSTLSPQLFAETAKTGAILSWPFWCEDCHGIVGFEFNFQNNPYGDVWYNSRCLCRFHEKYQYFESSWQAVADRYFLESQNPAVKALLDQWWKFDA